jgi:hypothetical protein
MYLYLINLAPRPWLSAILLALLAFLPWSASAGMTPEEVKAFEGYKAKVEKGDASAQFSLGTCYLDGAGVAKDQVEAVTWYRKAADQGYAQAQFNLGVCYDNGVGVAKDEVEAVKWYRKAADQGYAQAQNNLGLSYATGSGVTKDEIEAYAYWNLAGITHEKARNNLAILEMKMSPDARLLGQQRTKQLRKEIEGRSESIDDLRKAVEKESLRKGA